MHYIFGSYNYDLSDPGSIPNLFLQHLYLVGTSTLIAILIAIPLGQTHLTLSQALSTSHHNCRYSLYHSRHCIDWHTHYAFQHRPCNDYYPACALCSTGIDLQHSRSY